MARIINEHIDIDSKKTHDFFDNRINKKLFHRYNLVNFQDNHPELALQRDVFEKAKITPMLNITPSSRILDIGCGVGRWGDELVPCLDNGVYVGLDFSENIIEVARKSAPVDDSHRKYYVGAFQNLADVLGHECIDPGFDVVIINGVLMYINDSDITCCMNNVVKARKENSVLYIKESVGVNSRYTLKDIYSEELSSDYNAIYRCVTEYQSIFDDYFGCDNMVTCGEIFTEGKLHNRSETTSYYWIYK